LSDRERYRFSYGSGRCSTSNHPSKLSVSSHLTA
jgi:hypothetical protein